MSYRGRARSMAGPGRPPMPRMMDRQFQPHVPFDMGHCEQAFPRVTEQLDDKDFTELLVKRNQELSPTAAEQTAMTALLTKIQTAIDGLIVAPDRFEAAIIEEARPVGSFKKGTMVRGKNVADLVIILRTLPTCEAVTALGKKLMEDMSSQNAKGAISLLPHDKGFDVTSSDATVKCLISTIPINIMRLEPDLHLPGKLLSDNLAAIRHTRWFEENATHTSVKVLVRLLKDLRQKYSGFQCLNPWLMDLLAHHAIMSNPTRTPLPINIAFRRALSLLSSGIFLPGSIGILDPCESTNGRAHIHIPLEQMDLLCLTAQTLIRVLAHGGYKQIFQLEGVTDLVNTASQWGNVVVVPSQPVYEKAFIINQQEDEEEMNGTAQVEAY